MAGPSIVMIASPSSKRCVSGALGVRLVACGSVVQDVQEGPCLQCVGLGTLLLRRMSGAVVAVGSGGSSPKADESPVGNSVVVSVTVTEGVTGIGGGGRGVASGAAGAVVSRGESGSTIPEAASSSQSSARASASFAGRCEL